MKPKMQKKAALIEMTAGISNRDLTRALMVALAARQPFQTFTVDQIVVITVQPVGAPSKGTKGKM